jgi:hypothetical protein
MSNKWIPISIQNESHVETRMFVTLELIVTVWWVIMSALGSHVANTYSLWQPLPCHVHLWRNSHPEVAQIHTEWHIWLLLYSSWVLNFRTQSGIFDCFYTALEFSTSAKSFNHKDTAYLCPLHVLFVNRYHPMLICDPTGNRKSLKSKFIRSVATGDRKSFKYKFTHSTYILSDNDCHTMCFCAEIGTTKSLEFTVL